MNIILDHHFEQRGNALLRTILQTSTYIFNNYFNRGSSIAMITSMPISTVYIQGQFNFVLQRWIMCKKSCLEKYMTLIGYTNMTCALHT